MKKTIVSFGVIALGLMFASGPALAQSSVSSGGGANTLVSAGATAAAASQTGGIIAGAVGGAIGGGVAPAGPVVQNLDGRFASRSTPYFSSRALAGKSAGKQPRAGFWVLGGYTSVDNDEAGGKFDGDIINVLAGLDYKPAKFNGKMVVGIAAGYEDVDINTAFNTGTFEGSGFTIAPYFGYQLHKNWSIDGSGGIAFLEYDTSRTSNAVKGNFDGLRAFGAVNLTGNYQRKKWRFTPKVGVMGLWEEQDAYTETGTSTATVGKTRIHLIRINIGGEVGYRIKKVEPFVSARLQYDPDRNSPVTLTTGLVASDDDIGAVFGGGLNINGKKVSGQLKYETQQIKNDLTTHSFTGRVRFNF